MDTVLCHRLSIGQRFLSWAHIRCHAARGNKYRKMLLSFTIRTRTQGTDNGLNERQCSREKVAIRSFDSSLPLAGELAGCEKKVSLTSFNYSMLTKPALSIPDPREQMKERHQLDLFLQRIAPNRPRLCNLTSHPSARLMQCHHLLS